MKSMLILSFAALLLAPGALRGEEERVEVSTTLALGLMQVDSDTDSAQLNRFRDLRNGFFLFDLWLDGLDPQSGRFLELRATDVSRDDQSVWLRTGRFGRWGAELDWDGIPFRISNHAQTPYFHRGGGFMDLPGTVVPAIRRLATDGGDVPLVLETDQRVAAFLDATLRPVTLGTQRDRSRVALSWDAIEAVDLRLIYRNELRRGSRLTYGPIGDRPPRTLNVQLPEPVDQRSQDLRFELDHVGARYVVGFRYEVSDFDNDIETFTWRNLYANPEPGADFDAWDRLIGVRGRRPLAPDNRFHNANITFGLDTPMRGRLNITAAFGSLEQNQQLLPYGTFPGVLVDPALPRDRAEAKMSTTHLHLVYTFNPTDRLNVRTFLRHYDLDNRTREDQWWYVTQDAANLNGTRSYKNRRINLAHDHDSQNLGVDTLLRLGFWRSTVGVGYEREEIGRSYRESDTSEDRLKLQWRGRPTDRFSLRVRYLFGDRRADGYDPQIDRSFWYTQAQVTDLDNPVRTFGDHPDMRRFDVSDRRRHQVDVMASATPGPRYGLSATVRFRDDDFDSGVRPTQPLLGTGLPDEAAFTPGDQLGLLEETRWQLQLDGFFASSERLTWTAHASLEQADSFMRSLEYNENFKETPGALATAELGPWTRAASQWTADFDDRTAVFGLGASYVMVPDRVTLSLDSSVSRSRVDIDYRGFGVTNWDGTPFPDDHVFAFRTPPTIRHDNYVVNATVEMRLRPGADLVLGYLFDRYEIRDWQQEANTPWYESVGSEYLLRDTARTQRWGNRLVNMGSYLAPGYDGHVAHANMVLKF